MNKLCFVDTETTGLDPDIHQAYEVCWWREDQDEPTTVVLPHTLERADDFALEVGHYYGRGFKPGRWNPERWDAVSRLAQDLATVTLIGSNPAFDAAFLRKTIGEAPWHHRLVNVAEGAMWIFGWERPRGLADVTTALREQGYTIPEPDHSAEGDVRTTRAVYFALREIRSVMGPA